MAKRKKAATRTVATRRTSRRGKQTSSVAPTEGEPSASVEATAENNEPPSPQPSTSELQSGSNDDHNISESQPSEIQETTSKPNPVPIISLHKKFGKYRCLFNSDDAFLRKYEIGSDSETNSSMEIRIVDPCASSESDSNAAIDTQSDTNSVVCISPMNSVTNVVQCSSRDISPLTVIHQASENHERELDEQKNRDLESPSILDDNSQITDDFDEKIEITRKESPVMIETDALSKEAISSKNQDLCPQYNETDHSILLEDDQVDYNCDDEEIITVVQIVEDDNPELYYDIKIDSPKVNAGEFEQEQSKKSQEIDFQRHFQNLKLNSIAESTSPMECSEIIDITTPCGTPDLQPPKDSLNDLLIRPDPSLTPSSTLSDDSNCSRADHIQNNSNDSAESSPTGVRRSNRIKTISNLKQKTKGYGLVKTPLKKALITQTKLKLEEIGSDSQEKFSDQGNTAPNSPSFPVPSEMPVKVKSRWRRSSELEMGTNSPASSPLASPGLPQRMPAVNEGNESEEQESVALSKEAYDKIIEDRMNQYQHLDENEYLCERMISKETKKMICDCFMTKEELERGELACGEDCLNRLLMIECNSRCPVGDRCTNRRFQKRENAAIKVFYADKKGCGVEANVDIPTGEFLMEYVGEVLDYEQFYKRAQAYSDENNLHHYFMSLKGDTVIDATMKGNISRFINHSCDPNAETQKWTVNGELRIGFFSKRDIVVGEEITFDYQFQRFGKVAQRCYCGTDNCRGWIGGEPDSDDEYDDEEEEDVSTSKSSTSEGAQSESTSAEQPLPKPRKPKRDRKYKPKPPELEQDADIEEDLEALNRTGVKNQSHTLRLSRTVVRAKGRKAQIALLRLLRDADLPCRRLFLDYRGLRLLAPWCTDAPLDFKLEMLQTVDRLPIPNKTLVQESRFFIIVERWLSTADTLPDNNVFIDEATGLPIDLPNGPNPESAVSPDKIKENMNIVEKIKDLSSQLLERWSSLKEVFKIPKKERIQQMKEHERQANVERRAADSSGSRDRDRERDRREERDREREKERERDRERERERERDREREREKEKERERDRHRERERDRDRDRDRDDRDRRKRRVSPEGRRSIRLSERVLAAVPPMSKEERRRAFAEAAAAAEETRRQREQRPPWPGYWPHEQFSPMFPGGMMGNGNMMGGMMPNMPANMLGCVPDLPQDWMQQHEFPPPGFCPPFPPAQPFCMPQANMMGMSGFGVGGFMYGQQMAPFPQPQEPPLPSAPVPAAPPPAPRPPTLSDTGEVLLPSQWRSTVDPRGRTYYYHVKLRQPQWYPPPLPPSPPPAEDSSSDEEEQLNSSLDSPLVMRHAKGKLVEGVNGIYEVIKEDAQNGLIPEHALLHMRPRKRRVGLVSERPISPRTEEDKLAGKLEIKRYKQTKEKLRRRREKLLQKVMLASGKLKLRPGQAKLPLLDLSEIDSGSESDSDEAEKLCSGSASVPPAVPAPPAPAPAAVSAETSRRIKEQFRSAMAGVMVQHLNPYRHSDAPAGRITCTADFKHLARKLTHFVMLKELKHCRSVEELVVTDSVRSKAKTFVKKYMAKFGPVYKRPPEEAD
ncbi:histone-lysine N-methyltransferase SETD2 isoform X2 [Bombyx mori]|uniref:[histone H3]-lysine(36) N-trimethyltransferase n=1 Tax=Bombyx mori TaxID=7091 RepID=A0A8R1WKN8_BOMMO|nr:histone-lysine N-methyltransferase SETD2 isoform X2 [Bombyx mori]